ncbi:hypothetical protein A6456_33790 [Paraburkholderia tropica]|nr:hypothetical protein A6456_33790 [Paraburkholderia tropica]
MKPLDTDCVCNQNHVVGESIDGIGPRRGATATVTAQIDAQDSISRREERRNLFSPESQIRCERMRKGYDLTALGTDEVIA